MLKSEYEEMLVKQKGEQDAEAVRRDKIRRCLQSEDGQVFLADVYVNYKRALQQLKSVREPIELGRYQGRVEALEQILKMKGE
jgi:hypothetical protein